MLFFDNILYASDSYMCTFANSEDRDKIKHHSIRVYSIY